MDKGIRLLRTMAIVSFIITVAFLLVGGYFAKQRVAPIPAQVVDESGRVVTTGEEIRAGQDVFQRYGLMDVGSLWGHGTLRGLDFSADTLHRVGVIMRDFYAAGSTEAYKPGAFEPLDEDRRAVIDARVIRHVKANRYDLASNRLVLSPGQAFAYERLRDYWDAQFKDGDQRAALLPNTIGNAEHRRQIAAFFFWAAWAAGANRPGLDYTYTNNWPADLSVGNAPPPGAIVWSIASILGLLAVLGVVIYTVHRYRFFYGPARGVQAAQLLMEMTLTPSQRASAKFFLVAGLLFVAQILNGGLLANYTVNPGNFYIKAIGETYAYSWAKTWHLQLAIFWIAISWVGTAIFIAPMIARREPAGQRTLVNLLFIALAVVLVGSLFGEVLGLKGKLGEAWFWVGHQGWEYLELGRLWQILLFAGLIFWLVIVYRALVPALRDRAAEPEHRSLLGFYVISSVLVVAFFGFGLMYGRGTHFTIADYWRWFVVHIWVESIFEFFGIAVVALFLVTLGLVSAASAVRVAYLTATLVFLGGMLGTAHHYFWTGGPGFWLAIGSVFSSLEVIPLILLVVRAWMEYKSITDAGQEFPYRWPLYFLIASSVWNFLGAAIFGFMINLPIINYYEHATYLTANHAHTALFGVYGMLAISLILFSWRGLVDRQHWNDKLLRLSFWALNGGLALMFVTTLFPIGIMQVSHSRSTGLWWARSPSFYELPLVQMLGRWRIVPDLILIVLGALPLVWFLLSTFTKLRKQVSPKDTA